MTADLPGAVLALLEGWAPGRRWFPSKGAATARLVAQSVRPLRSPARTGGGATGSASPDAEADATVLDVLLRVETPDGHGPVLHVPVVLRAARAVATDPAPGYVGVVGDGPDAVAVHDGAQDPSYWSALLATMEWESPADRDAPRDLTGARVVTGEQSNTSVLLPGVAGGAILKVLRTVAAGPNPDLDVPRALTRIGWGGVPRPLAWSSVGAGADETHLAVLSELVPGADDGFELACAYARRGEPFTRHARDLGALVADLHAALREAFGTGPTVDAAWLVADLRERAARAEAGAAALTSRAGRVSRMLDLVADDLGRADARGTLPSLQRIHGDLHLGQVLHGADGWRVLDFEGEPLRPVADRTREDLALRDVAGMLRSFDYAAAVGDADGPQWGEDARTAFLAGYARAGAGQANGPASLLAGLELDKALYEVVYETQNRVAWLPIPLRGVDRLLSVRD